MADPLDLIGQHADKVAASTSGGLAALYAWFTSKQNKEDIKEQTAAVKELDQKINEATLDFVKEFATKREVAAALADLKESHRDDMIDLKNQQRSQHQEIMKALLRLDEKFTQGLDKKVDKN